MPTRQTHEWLFMPILKNQHSSSSMYFSSCSVQVVQAEQHGRVRGDQVEPQSILVLVQRHWMLDPHLADALPLGSTCIGEASDLGVVHLYRVLAELLEQHVLDAFGELRPDHALRRTCVDDGQTDHVRLSPEDPQLVVDAVAPHFDRLTVDAHLHLRAPTRIAIASTLWTVHCTM